MGRMPVPHRPKPFNGWGCPLPSAWGITRRFHRLSPSAGLVAYALRTRAPLSEVPKGLLPFDLHVLGLPLAFILSQDQTLRCTIDFLFFFFSVLSGPPSLLSFGSLSAWRPPHGVTRRHATVLASSYQRTSANSLAFFRPLVLSFAGAKVQPFSLRATPF